MAYKKSTATKTTASDNSEAKVSAVRPKKAEIRDFDPNTRVEVKSNFYGTLFYQSSVTGTVVEWSNYGDVNIMTLAELKNMRNSQRRFFVDNWVTIIGEDAQEILEWLQIDKYYGEYSDIGDIDEVFDWTPAKIKSEVSKMPSGLKNSIALKAYDMIEGGELDSINKIRAIEEATGCDLMEK